MFTHASRLFALIILFCFIFSMSVMAQTGGESAIRARLISGVTGTGSLSQIDGGLSIMLAEGWNTYWRTAGDSGMAPTFDWSASQNLKDVQISWPLPTRMEEQGLFVYGYKENTILPLLITPVDVGKQIVLSLKMTALVCKGICVPHNLTAALTIPAGSSVHTPDALDIKKFKSRVAKKDNTPNLKIDTAVLAKDAVVMTAFSKNGFDGAEFFVETKGMSLAAPPHIIVDDKDKTRALIRVNAPVNADLTKEFLGQKIITTLHTASGTVEKEFSF